MVSIALYRSCTATDGSTHSYCVLSMDVCALVTSSSSSWSPPHKSGLAHTAPLTRSRFIRTCSCWFLTPPKKVSQHHPPVTHTHTGLIRNERRKSESFCKTSPFGLYVHNLHATWWFLDPQRVKRSTDFVRCHFTNVCLTNSINHLGRLRVNTKKKKKTRTGPLLKISNKYRTH